MRPESLARKAEAARTLAALGDRTDLDSELARAEAWELLDPERARAAYERIAAAYPGDVRAPARLLDHDLFLARDLRGACGQVENAGPDGRDSEYYAALVQCGWAGLLRTIADRAGGPRTSQEDADALSTWQRFLVAAEEYAAVDARHAVMLRMIALEVASWAFLRTEPPKRRKRCTRLRAATGVSGWHGRPMTHGQVNSFSSLPTCSPRQTRRLRRSRQRRSLVPRRSAYGPAMSTGSWSSVWRCISRMWWFAAHPSG
jgi:hypothetical protein